MTRQSELPVWRRVPPEQRRRLVARLGQPVARQLKTARPKEEDGDDTPQSSAS
jgi:hypothetical protein